MREIKLYNNVVLPVVGLGTWQITDRLQMKEIIKQAFLCGYRLIDTAAAYGNEIAIGKAIKESGIEREKIFLSDKVWNTNRGFTEVQEACKRSLKKLKMEYLDSYLIHWPASNKLHENWKELNAETWRGMETLYQEGFVRSIGVCNFKIHHLEALKETMKLMPMINQVELHPGMLQEEISAYCKVNRILIFASSPLGNGKILEHPILKKIAKEKQKSPAQICLNWALEKELVVIPKTTSAERLRENMDVFSFTLSDEEKSRIDQIPFCGGIGIDADEVIEFG